MKKGLILVVVILVMSLTACKQEPRTFAEEICLDAMLLSSQGTEAEMVRRNSTHIAYVENYWEDGAQSPWKYQVWLMDIQTKEKAMLHEIADIYLLNELYMNEQYAYWVEHVIEGEQMLYFLKQCSLSTGDIIVIAKRDDAEAEPFSLWVSENYVTWMESNTSGNTKLMVFDVKKQEYINLDNIEAVRFMPYARLTVVENGITYFSTDEENVLYINRYNLEDSTTKSVKIDDLTKLMNTEKVAECFSNGRYIGWFTEYVRGTYYIYDTQSEKQYCLEGLNAFIELIWVDEMLFYNREDNKLAVFDLEKGSFTYKTDLPGSGTQLLYYQDSIPYMTLQQDGKVRIFSYK